MSTKEQPPHLNVQNLHLPVLLDDVVSLLNPQPNESYLDLTAGYGGHATAVLKKTGNYNGSVLVDRDDFALEHLSDLESSGVVLMHSDFLSAAEQLASQKKAFDMILIDLGVSSPQLDLKERGFSFKNDGPLDMRMDRRQEVSAKTLVNTASADELARIIYNYGEEPYKLATSYASAIVQARLVKSIETTGELAQIIDQTYRGKRGKTHPATRTFQALRIAVNDELGQIEKVLPILPKLLNKGGRLAVISFHSLEDRIVKRYLKEQARSGYEAELVELTKHPIHGSLNDVHNPRARSAKLRVAVKN